MDLGLIKATVVANIGTVIDIRSRSTIERAGVMTKGASMTLKETRARGVVIAMLGLTQTRSQETYVLVESLGFGIWSSHELPRLVRFPTPGEHCFDSAWSCDVVPGYACILGLARSMEKRSK